MTQSDPVANSHKRSTPLSDIPQALVRLKRLIDVYRNKDSIPHSIPDFLKNDDGLEPVQTKRGETVFFNRKTEAYYWKNPNERFLVMYAWKDSTGQDHMVDFSEFGR